MDIGDIVEILAEDIVNETGSDTGDIIDTQANFLDYVIEVEDEKFGGVRHLDVNEDEISLIEEQ